MKKIQMKSIPCQVFSVSLKHGSLFVPYLLVLFYIHSTLAKEKLKIEVTKESDDCIGRARNGDYLSIHYTGRLSNGVIFATSLPNKYPQAPYYPGPYRFTLGRKQVIQGYESGMQGMCVGEHRRFTMPPDLAYGDRGDGGMIPPGATLTFDVELVSIERPEGMKPDKSSMFDKIDANKDKKISKDEMTKYIAEFGRLHGDNEDQHSERTSNIFEKEDRNKDGFISVDEFPGPKREEL